jgi:multimeric flavodoxin WrbA
MPDQPNSARSFLFLLASARRDGNTEILARRAAASLPPEEQQRWIHLDDVPLAPFRDIRHDVGIYPQPESHERSLAEATLACTDLVLAVPLYWYSVPASAKLYLDYWSGWMRVPGLDFKKRMAGKRMWAFCALSDEDRKAADPLVGTLQLSANYMGMEWKGVLFGYGSRPGDVERDQSALAAAEMFFGG